MNLFSLGGFLSDSFADIWMSMWLSINDFVYSVISILYQVFEGVANVNLFSEDVFKAFSSRIYVIMGIAMLFIFAYNLILMIINPDDKKGTGQTTKMVKEVIISAVLIILLPTVFRYMGIFQRHVLESGIISQIILGDTGGTAPEKCNYDEYTILDEYGIGEMSFWEKMSLSVYELIVLMFNPSSSPSEQLTVACESYSKKLTPSQRGAYALPVSLFQAFYYPTEVDYNVCKDWLDKCKDDTSCSTNEVDDDDKKEMCAYYFFDVNMSKYLGHIKPFNNESKFYSKVKSDDGTFEFNGLLALVAGVIALYMFICYTIAIGVRVAKLGFLQIVSPITVMMRILPKQKEAIFDKWLKELINTYIDVFIRLVIIYFCLFSISLVPGVIDALFASLQNTSWWVSALSTVVVILGILMFAGQAPDLFKQFFGGGGNFALKSPKKQFNENKLAKGAVGYVGGSALGFGSGIVKGVAKGKASGNPLKGVISATTGAIGGFFRGGKNAAQNLYGADVTKKGAFTDTMKKSKYQTDYDQNHTKFKAVRSGIKTEGGVGGYAKKKWTDFVDFLGDANNQSEQYGAANKMFADSAIINDMIINGTIKGENTAKENWAKGENIDLGDNYYRRDKDRGVWIGPDGNEYNRSQMKEKMDDYYKTQKITDMATALAKNDKGQQEAFKRWSEDFNKTLMENLPKMGDEISQRFFKTISAEGGVKIGNMDELMAKMEELQKKGAAGDNIAFEQLARLKIGMDKGLKDIKDGSYDMSPKK